MCHVTHIRGLWADGEVGDSVGLIHLLIVVPHDHIPIHNLTRDKDDTYIHLTLIPLHTGEWYHRPLCCGCGYMCIHTCVYWQSCCIHVSETPILYV